MMDDLDQIRTRASESGNHMTKLQAIHPGQTQSVAANVETVTVSGKRLLLMGVGR